MATETNTEENSAPEADNVTELKSEEKVESKKEDNVKQGEEKKEPTELELAQKEAKEFKDKFYYTASELENTRKRFEREKESLIKYGNEKILSNLLDVVDNLERTIEAIKTEEDEKVVNIRTGVEMVMNQFQTVLKNNGLEQVEALGKIFDPKFHEAMAQQPAEGKEDQEIINEFQKGYILNGRLLRAAKVIVAKN